MPITVTIKYPIADAWQKPQDYGGIDPSYVDNYLSKRYKIKRVIVLDDSEKTIISDDIFVKRPKDAFMDSHKIYEIVEKAKELEESRIWSVHSLTLDDVRLAKAFV